MAFWRLLYPLSCRPSRDWILQRNEHLKPLLCSLACKGGPNKLMMMAGALYVVRLLSRRYEYLSTAYPIPKHIKYQPHQQVNQSYPFHLQSISCTVEDWIRKDWNCRILYRRNGRDGENTDWRLRSGSSSKHDELLIWKFWILSIATAIAPSPSLVTAAAFKFKSQGYKNSFQSAARITHTGTSWSHTKHRSVITSFSQWTIAIVPQKIGAACRYIAPSW